MPSATGISQLSLGELRAVLGLWALDAAGRPGSARMELALLLCSS